MRKIFFIFIFLVIANPVFAQGSGQVILQTEIPIPGEVPADYVPTEPAPEPVYIPTIVELKRAKAEKAVLAGIMQKRNQFSSKNKTAIEYNSTLISVANNLGAWAETKPENGETVRQMLKYQSDMADQIIPQYEQVMAKNKIRKFFFGTDFGKTADIKKNLKKAKRSLNEFELFKEKLRLNEDWAILDKNIYDSRAILKKISDDIDNEESRFSLFGWVKKIFV